MTTWKKRQPGPGVGYLNPRLVTFRPGHTPVIYILWKSGCRAPRSYHTSRDEALDAMRAYVKAGEECSVLEARPIASVQATLTVTEHDQAPAVASVPLQKWSA